MALDAKGNELEFAPNAGVWDSGSEYQNQDNAGLNALFGNYAALNGLAYPDWWDFAYLKAIDLSGIPEADYRQTISDDGNTVYDVACQPYESEPLKDNAGEILYDVNGEKLYPLKEF